MFLSRRLMLGAVLMAAGGLAASAEAGFLLYASTGSDQAQGGGRIYTIDPNSQIVTLIGNTGFDRMGGLDFNNNGVLYGVAGGSAGPATLMTINPNDATPNVIGAINGITGVDALAFDANNTLYGGGWSGGEGSGRLLTINPANANIITSILLNGSGNSFVPGLDFNGAGTLYGSRGNAGGHLEDLVTIDASNGNMTAIGGSTNVISDIWFAPDGTLYGGSPTGELFTINPNDGSKTFLFNTGIRISGLTGVPAPGRAGPPGPLWTAGATAGAGVGKKLKAERRTEEWRCSAPPFLAFPTAAYGHRGRHSLRHAADSIRRV